jgi:hypothetical protein
VTAGRSKYNVEDSALNELRNSLGGIDNVGHELRPFYTSDWLHLQRSSCDDLTPTQSAFRCDYAANTCRDIE